MTERCRRVAGNVGGREETQDYILINIIRLGVFAQVLLIMGDTFSRAFCLLAGKAKSVDFYICHKGYFLQDSEVLAVN